MDKKKTLPPPADWDEQSTFGNQSPYASSDSAPYIAPHEPVASGEPSMPFTIPTEAPPMYTAKAPPAAPSTPSAPSAPGRPQGLPASASISASHVQPQLQGHSQPYQEQPQFQHQPPTQPVQSNSIPYFAPPPPPPGGDTQQPYQQPLLPPQHLQQQQQPYNSGAVFTNYGATDNNNNNNNGYHGSYPASVPVPRSAPNGYESVGEVPPPRRRKQRNKPKSCSCCSCCCLLILFIVLLCWYLKGTIRISDGSCFIPEDSPYRTSIQNVTAMPDLALKFVSADGIVGNVLVKESDTFDIQDVRISIVLHATSTELLDQLEDTLVQDETLNTHNAHSRVQFKSSLSKEAKERLMRGNCARATVEIIYPRGRPGTGKLELKIGNGEVNVKMAQKKMIASFDSNSYRNASVITDLAVGGAGGATVPLLASFEEVQLYLVNGDINIENLIVSQRTNIDVANGHISGDIKSAGKVFSSILNGPVDLTIDTTPQRSDWDPENLEVEFRSVNGRINLNLLQRFLGHFSLSNAVGALRIRLPDGSKDQIHYQTQNAYEIVGWISSNSTKPQNTHPSLVLGTINGAITANIHYQKN